MTFHRSGRPVFFHKVLRHLIPVLSVYLAALFCPDSALAASVLSVQTRVQQQFYEPLIPVSKNFRTCFKAGPNGAQIMSICTDSGPASQSFESMNPKRIPAGQAPAALPSRQPSSPQPQPRLQQSQTPQRTLPSSASPPSLGGKPASK